MTAVKTTLDEAPASSTPFTPSASIPQSDVQRAIESVQQTANSVASAQFVVAAASSALSAERVTTDSNTVAWDHSVAGQAKAHVQDYISNTDAQGTFAPKANPVFTGTVTANNIISNTINLRDSIQLGSQTLPNTATIWTSGNDGAGSGLDADTLDGLNSDDLVSNTYAQATFAPKADPVFTGIVTAANVIANTVAVRDWLQLGSQLIPNTATIWTSDNDGTGSGLDADTLDGQDSSAFAPVNSPVFTGTVTANNIISNTINLRDSIQIGAQTIANTATIWTSANDGTGTGLDADTVDGHHAPVGKHTLFIPASAMLSATTSGPASAQVETNTNDINFRVLDFDAGSDEHAHFHIPMPKSWNEGTITFQVFWTTTATDTDGVAWALQAVAISDNEASDASWGTAVVVTDDAQGAAGEILVTSESSAVTVGGSPAEGDIVFFRIFRDVSDTNDDMTEDARLIGIKLFITTDAVTDA